MGITPRRPFKPWPLWLRWALVISVLSFLVFAISQIPPAPPPRPRETPLSRCIDAGGIPTTSMWDGRLTNCIFPPASAKP